MAGQEAGQAEGRAADSGTDAVPIREALVVCVGDADNPAFAAHFCMAGCKTDSNVVI